MSSQRRKADCWLSLQLVLVSVLVAMLVSVLVSIHGLEALATSSSLSTSAAKVQRLPCLGCLAAMSS